MQIVVQFPVCALALELQIKTGFLEANSESFISHFSMETHCDST